MMIKGKGLAINSVKSKIMKIGAKLEDLPLGGRQHAWSICTFKYQDFISG